MQHLVLHRRRPNHAVNADVHPAVLRALVVAGYLGSLGHSSEPLLTSQTLRSFATRLPVRVACLAICVVGIALFLPTIFAMLVNPGVWSEAAVSVYFVLATLAACFYVFVKRVALLLFSLPAIACFLVFSLSFMLS